MTKDITLEPSTKSLPLAKGISFDEEVQQALFCCKDQSGKNISIFEKLSQDLIVIENHTPASNILLSDALLHMGQDANIFLQKLKVLQEQKESKEQSQEHLLLFYMYRDLLLYMRHLTEWSKDFKKIGGDIPLNIKFTDEIKRYPHLVPEQYERFSSALKIRVMTETAKLVRTYAHLFQSVLFHNHKVLLEELMKLGSGLQE